MALSLNSEQYTTRGLEKHSDTIPHPSCGGHLEAFMQNGVNDSLRWSQHPVTIQQGRKADPQESIPSRQVLNHADLGGFTKKVTRSRSRSPLSAPRSEHAQDPLLEVDSFNPLEEQRPYAAHPTKANERLLVSNENPRQLPSAVFSGEGVDTCLPTPSRHVRGEGPSRQTASSERLDNTSRFAASSEADIMALNSRGITAKRPLLFSTPHAKTTSLLSVSRVYKENADGSLVVLCAEARGSSKRDPKKHRGTPSKTAECRRADGQSEVALLRGVNDRTVVSSALNGGDVHPGDPLTARRGNSLDDGGLTVEAYMEKRRKTKVSAAALRGRTRSCSKRTRRLVQVGTDTRTTK